MKLYTLGVIALLLSQSIGAAENGTNQIEIENTLKSQPESVSTPSQPKPSNLKNVEKIEVTGSYIRRIDVEGPSPLVTIDREAIDNTGNTTIEDVLRESTYFESVYGGGKSGYEGHVRFHGQHAGNTLILLNGLRLPKEQGGFYTSVSYIPSSAIERVELLKDGSSALYGSDAMAGVINFITRKDYSGVGFNTKYSVNEEGLGQEQNYTLSFGKASSRGSFLMMAQYRKLDPYNEYDLGFRSTDPKLSAFKGPSGSFKTNGQNQSFGPRCKSGTDCRTDSYYYDYIQNQTEDISSLMTGEYEFNSSTRVSLLGIYNHKTQIKINDPLYYEDDFNPSTIKNFRAAKNLKPANESDNIHIKTTTHLGEHIVERVSDTTNTQFKLQKDFGDTWNWQWSTGYTYQDVESTTLQGDGSREALKKMAINGEWDPSIEGQNLASAARFPTLRNSGQLINSKFVSSGELFDLNEGVVSMAIGAEMEYEDFSFNHDEGVNRGEFLSYQADNYNGYRRVQSGFVEFSANPRSNLEVQLAGRFDNYNDVGSTANPKLAVALRPHRTTLLRASYGTGFKPPGISDLFTPSYQTNQGFRDIVGSDGAYVRKDVTVVRNPEVTFETSKHYNFGAVVEPVKSLTFTLDQWNFEGKGTISNFPASNAMAFYEQYGLEGMQRARNIGLDLQVDPNTNQITYLQVPNVFNRSEKILRGVDFAVEGKGKARLLKTPVSFGVKNEISHIFERKERNFDFTALETLDDYGTKNTVSAHVTGDGNYLSASARTLLNGDRESVRNGYDFPVYTEYDVTYAFSSRNYGKFSLTVKNLLNTTPEVDTGDDEVPFGELTNVYSALGRRFVVGYSIEI